MKLGKDLTAHAGSLYWDAQGAIVKLPASGGTPITLVPSTQYPVTGLAVDASDVYFAMGDPGADSGSINKVPLDGGSVVTVTTGMVLPRGVSVDAQRVYCYDSAGSGSVVLAAPLAGGATQTLATSPNYRITGLAADSSGVYWVESGAPGKGEVMKLSSGGQQVTLAPVPGDAIVLGGQNVYWLDNQAGTVKQIAKLGGATQTLATGQTLVRPVYIAANDSGVYWANVTNSSSTPLEMAVMARIVGSAAPVVLASGNVIGIAADATSVYWMNDKSLMKLTLK